MPVVKTPQADLRRRYPLFGQVGLALSLGLVILAFTVPTPPNDRPAVFESPDVPFVPVEVPPTAETLPPPPPPAPPPPIEVVDEKAVDDALLDEFILDPEAAALPPAGPPTASVEVSPPPPPGPPPAPPAVRTEVEDEGIRDFSEVQPELIGGIAGLQARTEYPEMARRVGIEGQVVVQFVVDERGNVVDPVVLRSPNDLLSEAAVKAVQESRFTPGQQRGRPVKVRFAVPVTFRLR